MWPVVTPATDNQYPKDALYLSSAFAVYRYQVGLFRVIP